VENRRLNALRPELPILNLTDGAFSASYRAVKDCQRAKRCISGL